MLTNTITVIPRYNEVDQMGYVYHANYISYCHQARTELMRKAGVCDAYLEANEIMMPVVSFEIKYKKPVGYDEPLQIKAILNEEPELKMTFSFEFTNSLNERVGWAKSSVVFVSAKTRKPMRVPEWLKTKFDEAFNLIAL